ncbi:MAG TPA: flagellar hook protein FlgE, partial [Enterobacteriaceae bacterium]|nr:flagellar hook protein FlgE [Enterobacteriaceae bacterium]
DFLQGYPVNESGALQTGTVTDLQIKTGSLPARATSTLTFGANFNAADTAIDTSAVPFDPANAASYNTTYTTTVYDSLGNEHAVSQYFTKTADNSWEVHYSFDGATQPTTTTLAFDEQGKLVSPAAAVPMTFSAPGAAPIAMTFDYAACTQYGSAFSVTTNAADGYASAQQNGVQVDGDGKIYATYSNGERMLQGQLVLATFPDEDGLRAISGTAWVQTGESGTPLVGTPGSGTFGALSTGMLENSNVDITSELVDLMTAQRNYQANTKVISASSELDQALFQAM